MDINKVNTPQEEKIILPASYKDDEEWVKEYKEQFGEEPSFF